MATYQRQLSNGNWVDLDDPAPALAGALARGAYHRGGKAIPLKTEADVVEALARGVVLNYDTDPHETAWYMNVRRKPEPRPTRAPELVRCDCGHSVEKTLVMSASLGSSCPDCYDRMSD